MSWRILGIAVVIVFAITFLLTSSLVVALGAGFVALVLGSLADSLTDLGRVPPYRLSQESPEDARAAERHGSGDDV
ncbi:MAG: hypothetical protein JWP66_1549 [Naasia sp.]|nr:hypothetical protein [Naasia sp.]